MADFKSDADCKAFFLDVCEKLDAIARLAASTKDKVYTDFVKTDIPYKNDSDYEVNIDYMNQHYLVYLENAIEDLSNDVYDELNAW